MVGFIVNYKARPNRCRGDDHWHDTALAMRNESSNYVTLGFIVLYVLKNGSNECKKKRLKVGFHITSLVLQDLRTTPTKGVQTKGLFWSIKL